MTDFRRLSFTTVSGVLYRLSLIHLPIQEVIPINCKLIRQGVPKLFVRTFLYQELSTYGTLYVLQYVSTPLQSLSIH